MSGACNADNQMQVAETDSNSYRIISMWIEDEEVIIVGTKMSELIFIHITEISMKYSVYDVTTYPTTS